MSQQNAFGVSGCATGVHLNGHFPVIEIKVYPGGRAAEDELFIVPKAFFLKMGADQELQLRKMRLHRLQGRPKGISGNESNRFTVFKESDQLSGRQPDVERDKHGSNLSPGQIELGKAVAIRKEPGNPIAEADTQTGQAVSQAIYPVHKLAKAESLGAAD